MPGCFLKDRKSVVVTGVNYATTDWGLYEIDLRSGNNRMLGGGSLAHGMVVDPVLSPDGKTIAVSVIDLGLPLATHTQINLVDLASGTARAVGPRMDCSHLSWEPDGRGIILLTRKYERGEQYSVNTVSRLALDGTVTSLFKGDDPMVLRDGRILSREDAPDHKTWTWKTSKADGTDQQLFADGMPGYSFPTLSPDGGQILMMKYVTGRGPVPTIFRVGEASGRPATNLPGFWMTPEWQ
jgi:Tol biopolymer transport system component